MKNCTLLRREAHVEVKKYKAHQNTPFSDHFSKLRCRKSARRCGAKRILEVKMHKAHQVHGALLEVVARSTFQSQNVQNTPGSEHFWKLRCRNSARRCGGKHISKSKCTKHTRFGALLEVEMLKKRTALWREAHVQVIFVHTGPHAWTTFEGSDMVLCGRHTKFRTWPKVSKT